MAITDLASAGRRELVALGAATLGESGATALTPAIRPMWRGAAFAAPALTVSCAPGDNLAIHAAVAAARPGAALAVSVAGESARGYWGEVLTVAAQAAGVAALVVDGEVRDLDAIERHRFPVFARGAALRGATKTGPGALDVPVALGGAVVRPGDWLVGDADGVVVIAARDLPACRAAGAARQAREQEFFARLQAGASTVGLLSLDVTSIENA